MEVNNNGFGVTLSVTGTVIANLVLSLQSPTDSYRYCSESVNIGLTVY